MPKKRKRKFTHRKQHVSFKDKSRQSPQNEISIKQESFKEIELKPQILEPQNISELPINFYSCHLCDYRTKSNHSSSLHLRRHWRQEPPFSCTEYLLPYRCDKCHYQTHLTLNFLNHVCDQTDKVHHILFCDNCGFRTYSNLILMKHIKDKCARDETADELLRIFNVKQKDYFKCYQFLMQIGRCNIEWFKCQHCTYMAKMMGSLGRHTVNTHLMKGRQKWFECELCVFNVEQIFHLRKHILKEHGEDMTDMGY